MLTMTPTAAEALAEARSAKGAPDDYAVRFFASTKGSDKVRLKYHFVAEPRPGDEVMRESGLEAFVAPEIEELIGDIVIDVETNGQRAALVLRRTSGRG
jgi:Fe-S cluster assembly iron-binding protein IscA